MRFSRPITTSRLRSPMSASIRTTVCPCCASAVPRLAVVVVLPTPPLPDVMTIALPMELLLEAGGERARQPAPVFFDDDVLAHDVGDLGVGSWLVAVGGARDDPADAQLVRLQPQRDDEGGGGPDPGVRGAAQAAHHDDAAGGAELGARVDVAEDDEVGRVLEDDARADRTDDDARPDGLGGR